VHSAQPTARALKLCPQLIIVDHGFAQYSSYSRKVFEVVQKYSPVFEQTGIDEGYLDMTGCEKLFGPPLVAAQKIKDEIFQTTKLQVSVGIGSNRMVAKIATDMNKPNGLTYIPAGREAEILAPLKIEKIPGCGKKTAQWMHDHSIYLISDLQKLSPTLLNNSFGSYGEYLHRAAFGKGSVRFNEESLRPSISRETTFEDFEKDQTILEATIRELSLYLSRKLRRLSQSTRQIKIKIRDPQFKTITRMKTLDTPTNSDEKLWHEFRELFLKNWDSKTAVRLIGLGASLFLENENYYDDLNIESQISLFDSPKAEEKKIEIDS
jgi:DNA polymerase-4